MQKFAQKRNILNKLREMTNVSGIAAEKFFDPKFKEIMETLRLVDENIRDSILGKSDKDGEEAPLKTILKSAKSNLARREYMMSAADLGRFHKKMIFIIQQVDVLSDNVDKVHHEFLFNDEKDAKSLKRNDQYRKHLQELNERFAFRRDQLIKEAGIMDFFHNVATSRGRRMALWEKRYPDKAKKLKIGLEISIGRAESLWSVLLDALKEMASARSVRNIDAYLKSASKIISSYDKFDDVFKQFYKEQIKPYLEQTDYLKKEELKKDEPIEDTKKADPSYYKDIEPGTEDRKPYQVQNWNNADPMIANLPNTPANDIGPTGSIPGAPNSKSLIAPQDPNVITAPAVKSPSPLPVQVINPLMGPLSAPKTDPGKVPSFPPSSASSSAIPNTFNDTERPTLHSPIAHRNFYNSLQKMSNESPLILAMYIRKYAKSIQSKDTNTAIKLFKLASIIEG